MKSKDLWDQVLDVMDRYFRWGECKKSIRHKIWKEDYAWNPSTCACECNKKYGKKKKEYLNIRLSILIRGYNLIMKK